MAHWQPETRATSGTLGMTDFEVTKLHTDTGKNVSAGLRTGCCETPESSYNGALPNI